MARRVRRTTAVQLDPDGDADLHGGGLALDTESPIPPTGPHDSADLDPEVTEAAGLVDFGSIRVPVPPEGTVTVEPTAGGRMQAVHIRMPEGRLSVSALAAPKSSKLWPELANEIDASLREGGARVRSFRGSWGRELHATSGDATSVFVGVDGPRWMLYGVATGPSAHSELLDSELRRMLRGTVVERGKQPYPVRTILPLTVPEHLAAEAGETPAVPAAGTRKRSQTKAAPGKSAPGKTAPPNSDAATAAAKKAAARRAAARKAAAAAALKAAAKALAEHAAEDGPDAAERPDTARAGRSRSHPVPGTIPTGPEPDAPLHEQAPSARRAAAASWRERPVVPESEAPPPTEALPVARPFENPPVTQAFPAARAGLPPTEPAPPTEALRVVEPGTGGRRRLGEPAPPPSGGRRHLQDPLGEPSHPDGRRRLREPAADLPPPGARYRDPEVPESGRRRPPEPHGAVGATAPWDLGEPDGRRRLREPVADPGVPAIGRRRPQEPWDEAPPAPDAGVSSAGRRRLREPAAPVADPGVSATGRRRLREPGPEGIDALDPRWPVDPPAADAAPGAADAGLSASGRRRLREPWEPAAPVVDTGRRLREPWEEAGPDDGPRPREAGLDALDGRGGRRRLDEPAELPGADTGVSGTGRRRLRESWDGLPGAGPLEPAPGPLDGPGGRRGPEQFGEPRPAAETGASASGRRRLREPSDGPRSAADTGVSASGRRRLREPWDDGPGGRRRPDPGAGEDLLTGAGGRRRLREPEPPPVRDGSQTEPWLYAPDGPPEGSARRTLGAEYLIETGEQDPGWTSALDDYAERRDGGRHSGASDATVRLQTLLGELDPNRPRRRHRR
ncbi:DUF3710 domain-containing protein [Pseudonocardia cypriaca]|uniref:Uncharacterized protein DUF3710 n=1 Tax=Pseudonocardia cypriaca TaxID=882449 RepID=A0A543FU05_9PSEU|nr:DUF3710 domain-containing protein [Pseudonocardia cypriaca]TQM37310.1 uncharacterized protein DUF3710 [Pseudonocardia cypriaca]